MLFGGIIAGSWLLALEGRQPGALGFYFESAGLAETVKGLGLGVSVGLATVGLIALFGGVSWVVEDGTLTEWMTGALAALAFFAVPAAAEESVLRGYPLQALAEAWGPGWALLITSVAFGALHLANPNVTVLGVVNVAVAGLFLGVVYLKTASLWWATGAHLGWNWSHGFATDVPVSGLDLMDAPFYAAVQGGPGWLGGGAFGPEGSAVATVVVLGASALCWRTRYLAPSEAALRQEPISLARRPAVDVS